jgi:hypothetical protein
MDALDPVTLFSLKKTEPLLVFGLVIIRWKGSKRLNGILLCIGWFTGWFTGLTRALGLGLG